MLKLPDGTVKVLVEGVQRATHHAHHRRRASISSPTSVPVPAGCRRDARDRGAAPRGDAAVRPVRQAQQEDPARDPDVDRRHRRRRAAWPTRSPRTCRSSSRTSRRCSTCSRCRKRLEKLLELLEHEIDILQVEKRIRGRVKRQMEKSQREYYLNEQVKAIQKELGDGEEGADLEELEKKIKAAQMPQGGAQEGRSRAEEAQADVADVGRGHGGAQLHRHAGRPAVGEEDQDQARPGERRGGARTRTTTAWRRSRNASSSTSRCSSASTRSRRRSCAWSARRASARPRSARAWRAPPAASSCAWRWAACATRPRSAATAAPTSARCRARCCRA